MFFAGGLDDCLEDLEDFWREKWELQKLVRRMGRESAVEASGIAARTEEIERANSGNRAHKLKKYNAQTLVCAHEFFEDFPSGFIHKLTL